MVLRLARKFTSGFWLGFFLHCQTEESGTQISSQETGIPLYFYPKAVLNFLKMGKKIKKFMEFAEQAGTIFEVGSTIWGLIGKLWKFPRGIDQNVNNLKRKRDELNGQKEYIATRIESELHPRKKVRKEVELWFENVKRINDEIHNLESEVAGSSFFKRGCLVDNVCKNAEEVEELLEKGRFSDALVVDDPSRIGQVLPMPRLVGEAIARKRDEILGYLMNDEVRKIGIYGMPGVGKTSFIKLVNNEHLQFQRKFNIVVWVTVLRKCSVIELQNKIAEAMNIVISTDEDKTIRAGMLFEILNGKGKYALILDAVWDKFSLEEVGIPEPSASNGSKLVLTTRSSDVCRHMDCQEIKMEPLPDADAWTLFVDKAGRDDLTSSAVLLPVARSIAKRCAGLPLAIITVASSMRGEYSLPIWRNALDELNRNVSSIIDVKETVYQQLRFSYDRLNDRKIQNCFLSCAAYPEDSGIQKEQLIRDWIRMGLIDDMGNMKANLDKGQAIIRKLVDNCLLENVGNERVKMHDLVRDMALLINRELYES